MKTTKVTSMTVEEIQAATAALQQVRQGMEFILPLNPAERAAAGRLGPNAVQTTQMRLATAREHKEQLPPSFDFRKFERETALLTALGQCLASVKQIQADVRDTFLAIARTAVDSAKVAVGHLQVGVEASDNLKKSVRLLKRRSRATPAALPGAQPTPAAAPAAPAAVSPAVPADTPGTKAA